MPLSLCFLTQTSVERLPGPVEVLFKNGVYESLAIAQVKKEDLYLLR